MCYRKRLRRIRWCEKQHNTAPNDIESTVVGESSRTVQESRLLKRIRELDQLLFELGKNESSISVPNVVNWTNTYAHGDDNQEKNIVPGDEAGSDNVEEDSDDDRDYDYEDENNLAETDDDHTASFECSSDEAINTESIKLEIAGIHEGNSKENSRAKRGTHHHMSCSSSLI
ncbi:unnamed protein product [Echinostoma caproni]|uniref:BHLH domain-containing protein n=1 Tax=Echinostoma caproni TaxID=27848 RepID=A0A183BHA9_9TREM|nr:unnamed protein product [Echinostoma caproni]